MIRSHLRFSRSVLLCSGRLSMFSDAIARALRSQMRGFTARKSRPKISKSVSNLSFISSCHCVVRPAGTMISVRLACPRCSSACQIIPASMVLPNPTSSASRNRRLSADTTRWAAKIWCGRIAVRALESCPPLLPVRNRAASIFSSNRHASPHCPRFARSSGESTTSNWSTARILFSDRYGGGMNTDGLNSTLAWPLRSF